MGVTASAEVLEAVSEVDSVVDSEAITREKSNLKILSRKRRSERRKLIYLDVQLSLFKMIMLALKAKLICNRN